MAKKRAKDDMRISFNIPGRLAERCKDMPWGIRTKIMTILLEKVLDAVTAYGSMIYGAILDGDFKIVYKEKKK
jgi:hypothetical protein|tara:strand:- start:1089 stop:1307 length:219 start_codon:yes stop_codon:yes gene_type:complete